MSATTAAAILISGASSGIGRYCATALAAAGYRVFAGVRNESAADDLRSSVTGMIEPIVLDVTVPTTITATVERLQGERLAGLVNNAGVALLGPLEFLPVERIRQQFEVNLFGHIAVTQACLPLLRKNRGRIVNISSISGRIGFPFAGAYASSKFALEGFSESLRRELRPWGVHVSLIEPGNIKTPIWAKSSQAARNAAEGFPTQAFDLYGERLMRAQRREDRMGDPAMVADALRRALQAPRPKARYAVGRDARTYLFMRWLLPDRWFDRLI